MRVGIDARIYKTGIGRYVQNLISELPRVSKPEDKFIVFVRKDGFDEFQPSDDRFEKVLADFPPYSFAEQLLFIQILWKYNLDLVHFTNFNLPILWPGKYVVTIHDLIHMSHSTFGSSTRNYLYYLVKKLVYSLVIRWVAWRAKTVIVPSEDTKKDVAKYLGVSESKIKVTYEGAEEKFVNNDSDGDSDNAKKVLMKYGVTKPFLLYVATMYPHKNHSMLIDAFRKLYKDNKDLQLVLVGKADFFSKKVRKLVNELVAQGVFEKSTVVLPNFHCDDGYLPDEDLSGFYQNASLYVFPSLKEGFGIPILEAQAFGLPVICANISCLPEIGADSVGYFDADSPDDLVEKVKSLLQDESKQKQLTEKGYENLKRFSWNRMAKETLSIYREAE